MSLTLARPEAGTPQHPGGPTVAHRGHGRRLADAIQCLESFPVLGESAETLYQRLDRPHPRTAEIVQAIESDIALTINVMRLANEVAPRYRGPVESVVDAVDLLTPEGMRSLVSRLRTYDFFDRASIWNGEPERLRLHGLSVQRAAGQIARELHFPDVDRLMVTSLLHDVGKLVLLRAYPGYPNEVCPSGATPEQCAKAELTALGVDHAMVGGVLARRWGLPRAIASVIECHHAEDACGEAAIIRLADLLAHYLQGSPVDPGALSSTARAAGMDDGTLRRLMYALPGVDAGTTPRTTDPCPLSGRELEVLRELATGKVYKQIAIALGLSRSTIRSHLHNIYGKMGATDRAQAVLAATEQGWL